jgi:serine/threonine protein phosphatase PrpC
MTRFAIGTAIDAGRVRSGQEDFLLADSERALFAVADGMGGHRGGEIASHLAVETLDRLAQERAQDEPFTSEWFAKAVQLANDALVARASEDSSLQGMGTTLCALALVQGEGYEALGVVNVGDSRLYLLKDGELEQITEDHSLVATLERQGRLTRAEAAVHPQRNIVTRALGIDSKVMVDSWEIAPIVGDRYLLCSDGLFNEIDDNRIAATLRKLADPSEAANELVRLANEAGGRDNITCVIVDVIEDSGEPMITDGGRILSAVHGPDRVLAEVRESGEHAALVLDGEGKPPSLAARLGRKPKSEENDEPEDPVAARVHRRNVVTWRVMVFGLVFILIIAAAIGTIIYTGTNTYYVGFEGESVVIFQGRPGGVLWIDPQLQERTTLTRSEVPEGLLSELEAGKEQSDLTAARQYVANIEDQIASTRSTTPNTAPAPTASSSTTTTPATGGGQTNPGDAGAVPGA